MANLYAAPLGFPKFRAFSAAGAPLAGGKVAIYYSGTTNPAPSYPTYTDAINQTNANANPVILDANGEAAIFLPTLPSVTLLYKIQLADASSVVQWTIDNVNPAFSYPLPSITLEWTSETNVYGFNSGTQFTLSGNVSVDATGTYHPGRRIKATPGPLYGTVTSSSFAANQTTVNVVMDSGALTGGMQIYYGTNSYVSPSYLDPRTELSVIKNGTQTGFASSTQVTAWTVELDTNSEWNAANHRWIAKYPGKYLVVMSAEVSTTGAITMTTAIKKNGATVVGQAADSVGASAFATKAAIHILSLSAGDYLELWLTGDANTIVQANNASHISVVRIA